jgi:hypothetical protein
MAGIDHFEVNEKQPKMAVASLRMRIREQRF